MPENELAVCRRIRRLREIMGMSRVAFSNRLKLDSTRLANYEHARAPVPYEIGNKICAELSISQRWLATGEGPKEGYRFLPRLALEHMVPLRTSFMAAYNSVLSKELERVGAHEKRLDSHLFAHVEAAVTGFQEAVKKLHWLDQLPPQDAAIQQRKVLDVFLAWLPREQLPRVVGKVLQQAIQYYDSMEGHHGVALRAHDDSRKDLQSTLQSDKFIPVKWEPLRAKLNRLTKERGGKSTLAKAMGVPLSNVSLWLSGDREPGVNIGFRLLEWAEQQEREQK